MSTSKDLLHQILYISYTDLHCLIYLLVCMVGKYRYLSFLDTEFKTTGDFPKSRAQLLKNLNSFPHAASSELCIHLEAGYDHIIL